MLSSAGRAPQEGTSVHTVRISDYTQTGGRRVVVTSPHGGVMPVMPRNSQKRAMWIVTSQCTVQIRPMLASRKLRGRRASRIEFAGLPPMATISILHIMLHGDGISCPSEAATDSAGTAGWRSVPRLLRLRLCVLPVVALAAREELAGGLSTVSVTASPTTS